MGGGGGGGIQHSKTEIRDRYRELRASSSELCKSWNKFVSFDAFWSCFI